MPAVPTGTLFYVVSSFGSPLTVTAVSNASEAVVSCTAHGYNNGDVVEITSGWGLLNKRVFEVSDKTTDTFKLKGMDTSSTDRFPPGTGTGTVREISAWTQLSKVMNPQSQGGGPKTSKYKFTESDVEYSINDGFEATRMTLEFDDDDTTAGYTALRTGTDSQNNNVLKMLMRSGSRVYLPCTFALNDVPRLQDGQINRISAQFAGNNRHTRYSA